MLVIHRFIKKFYSSREGIYKLESDKMIPTLDEIERNDVLDRDFTWMELIYKIWWTRPFLCCFKGTKCMSNYKHYSNFYNMIIHELNFLKVYSKIIKIETG